MPRMIATLTATAVAAAVAAAPLLCPAAPAAATAYAIQQVTAADLGPSGPWVRLQDNPANAGRPAGVQQVVPFADGQRFNGSLHLAVSGGREAQQAQAAHYFNRTVPLSGIADLVPSYDSYVRGWTSTPSAAAFGANLQLPSFCNGAFTTFSFQPQLATDAQGRSGSVVDTWRHFVAGPSSLWATSRAVSSFAAGSSHPLSAYAAACKAAGDGAIGVIANVGRLGDAAASLDTYVDNIAVNGTVYEFTSGRATAQGRIVTSADAGPRTRGATAKAAGPAQRAGAGTAPGGPGGTGDRPAGTLDGSVTFSSPRNGPLYTSVGTRLVFSRPGGLAPGDLVVTANGKPVTLAAGPGRTLIAVVNPSATVDLGPGGAYRTAFTVAQGSPRRGAGTLSLTAELLAQGFQPLQSTGVQARALLRR
ncbi:hypothetical protein [Actinacidiphila rubida]|uniref:Uncharacterized protein n=1 Tax=Actinacidiphila rubida TaxID=310780 RepID=A0A1H8TM53_9ACTN|nr:hypothetical protein [Actinacidiphila rubida]SEO91684.1 hypothetical protein SAMN05216267_105522 [Actinacidiphila rubida]